MSAIITLVEICKVRDYYCAYFRHVFPAYHVRTFLTARSYSHNIEVVLSQSGFEFTALIPYDCKDPIVYFKDHYPEFFI